MLLKNNNLYDDNDDYFSFNLQRCLKRKFWGEIARIRATSRGFARFWAIWGDFFSRFRAISRVFARFRVPKCEIGCFSFEHEIWAKKGENERFRHLMKINVFSLFLSDVERFRANFAQNRFYFNFYSYYYFEQHNNNNW